jgi:hypothetical protein
MPSQASLPLKKANAKRVVQEVWRFLAVFSGDWRPSQFRCRLYIHELIIGFR